MKLRASAPLMASLTVGALALAGCSQAADGAATPNASTSSGSSIDAALGTQFSGGSPGQAASGDPITIGVINQEGGAVSDPEVSAAIQAVFDYLNAEQGGVAGRPLEMKLCKIASSEEEAQQCAQQMLNDDAVQVVLQGGLNVGTQAVHQTIGDAKPTIVTLGNPGPDTVAANTYILNPGANAAIGGVTTYALSQGYKSVALVADSNPGNLAIMGIAAEVMGGAGLEVTTTTFPEGTTDLTPTLTSALSTNPDAISPIVVSESGCAAVAKSLGQIETTASVLATSLCASDSLRESLGDLPKWAFEATTLLQYAPDATGQVAFYQAVMGQYAPADTNLGLGAPAAFGGAFALANILNGIDGELSSASIADAAKAFTGPVLMGTPKLKFGSVPDQPALGGRSDLFYIYKGDNAWDQTDWQNLPS